MTQPLYYKDLLSGQQPYSETELGRKGLSLAHLVAQKIPVPPFFVMPPDLFKSIVVDIFKDKSVASLTEFRKRIAQDELSPETKKQIELEYGKLSGFGRAWVAVRSSIVAPEHPATSFSGLLSSKLNVRGVSDIESGVKEIFMSLFSDRTYDYLKRNNISYGDVSAAIVVQKMIQAEVSGIMYTYDPITTNMEHVSIEAVFGLGDVLSDGNVNPDIYTVSKSTLEIVEKKIVPQEWMKVRKMGDTESLEHLQRITISKMWQYSQKLDDSLVRELTKLADSIEKALGGPQVIEWAMERGVLYVLQAKPIAMSVDTELKDLHANSRKITSMKDVDTFSNLANQTTVTVSHDITIEEKPVVLPPETLLFTGTPASPGTAYGNALLIPTAASLTFETIESLKKSITKKDILVADEFTAVLEQLFYLAGGVITNFGGANSDVSMIAREAQIPAIVGTRIATSYLQSGAMLKIDGSSGAIYRVEFIPDLTTTDATEKTVKHKKKHLKKKFAVQVDAPANEPKAENVVIVETTPVVEKTKRVILPKDDSPIKIFLSEDTDSAHVYSENLKTLSKQSGKQAVMLPISKASKEEVTAIKTLKKGDSSDIYLLLSDSPSVDALLQTKRDLAAQGVRRSKRVKYIASVGSMYGLLNAKTLIDLGVDGLVFDILTLANSYRPGSKDVDNELLSVISQALDSIRNQKLSFIGMILAKDYLTIPLRKELHAIVKKGVTSLIFPESTNTFSETDVKALIDSVMKIQIG